MTPEDLDGYVRQKWRELRAPVSADDERAMRRELAGAFLFAGRTEEALSVLRPAHSDDELGALDAPWHGGETLAACAARVPRRSLLRGPIRVRLVRDSSIDQALPRSVAAMMEAHPGPIEVASLEHRIDLPGSGEGCVRWDDVFRALGDLRARQGWPEDDFVVLLTGRPNEYNWFTSLDAQSRSAFIDASGYDWVTSAGTAVVVAFNVVQDILWLACRERGLTASELFHEETRGCVADFCGNKVDFSLKLRTGDICEDCLGRAERFGASDRLLRQMVALLDSCRRAATCAGRYGATQNQFADWPFPVAITKHKAVQARDPLHRFLLLLDHFDSLIRYACIAEAVTASRPLEVPDRPSLGWWVSQLRTAGQDRRLQDAFKLVEKHRVVHLRNEHRGHGYVSAASVDYAEVGLQLSHLILSIEQALVGRFVRSEPVLFRGMALRDGRITLHGMRLVGSNAIFPSFELPLEDGRNPSAMGLSSEDEVYLSTTDEAGRIRFHRASPYLLYSECPECGHERVLVTDGEKYLDVLVGHRGNVAARRLPA